MICLDQGGIGTLLIPNTVSLIRGAHPHPEEAKKLIDYLLSREVEGKLAWSESGNMPVRSGIKTPTYVLPYSSIKVMQVDYYNLSGEMVEAAEFCQNLFIR